MAVRRKNRPKAAPAAEMLPETYEMRDRQVVECFVRRHPEVGRALFEAPPALRRLFGDDARLYLDVLEEPDVNKDWQHLVVLVETKLALETAEEKLDQFYESWFEARVDEIGHLVSFHLRESFALSEEDRRGLALLSAWMAEPDDLGSEWWEEFERELRENPFQLGLGE